jgi:sec-independent protein translocase protein TatB
VFDIGFSELVVIGLVALIVLGPKRLPEVARAAGRWAARLRRFIDDTRREIDREIKDADLAALKEVHREIVETRDLLSKSASELAPAFSEPVASEPAAQASIAGDTPAPEAPVKSVRSRPSKKPRKSKKKAAPKSAPRKRHVRRKARTG